MSQNLPKKNQLTLFKYKVGNNVYYEKANYAGELISRLKYRLSKDDFKTVSSIEKALSKSDVDAYYAQRNQNNSSKNNDDARLKLEQEQIKQEVLAFLNQDYDYIAKTKNESDLKKATRDYIINLPQNMSLCAKAEKDAAYKFGPEKEIEFLRRASLALQMMPETKKMWKTTIRYQFHLDKNDFQNSSYDMLYVNLRTRILNMGDFDYNKDFTMLEYLDSVLCGFNHNVSSDKNAKLDEEFYENKVLMNNKIFNYKKLLK